MKLFIIAGEPSGDLLGAALIAGLRQLQPKLELLGLGGPRMAKEGLESLFSIDELAVIGLTEVLPKLFHLRRRIAETASAIVAAAPEAVITIDSPDFSLRVLARARRMSPRLCTIHYVAPSVWAWRPGRAQRMARVVDHVLTLLPFEPPLMEKAGMGASFVGHPAATAPQIDRATIAAFLSRYGVADARPLLVVLPGSRRAEIARLGPIFGAALEIMAAGWPGLRVIVPTLAERAAEIRALVASWPGRPIVLDAATTAEAIKQAAFAAADAALAASGTVSLELAQQGTPMVIAYRLNPLTELLIRPLLKVDTVTLVNLVSGTKAVPEFLGPACRPEALAEALDALLRDPAAQAAQRSAMAQTMAALGRGGEPQGLRAARAVLAVLAAKGLIKSPGWACCQTRPLGLKRQTMGAGQVYRFSNHRPTARLSLPPPDPTSAVDARALFVEIVKDTRLPWAHPFFGDQKVDDRLRSAERPNKRRHRRAGRADAHPKRPFRGAVKGIVAKPIHLRNGEAFAAQRLAWADDHAARLRLKADDVERFFQSAKAKALTLANGKVDHAWVTPQNAAFEVDNLAGFARARSQTRDEPGIIAVEDKADVLAVGLCGYSQPKLCGESPRFGFAGEPTQRKAQKSKLLAGGCEQEIRLIACGISGDMQLGSTGALDPLHIMAGGQAIGLKGLGGFEQISKFHPLIATDAWHGRVACHIIFHKFIDYRLPKAAFIIKNIMRDP